MNEQTQPTDAELAPCPFCGTQPDECDIGQFVVECPSCAIVGPTSDNSDAARRAWNTRWGTPAGAGEVVAWLSTDSIGERYLCFTKPKDTDPARPLVFGDTTPQPTQAQAGAVPLTDEQIDGITSDNNLDSIHAVVRYVERLHGIKGADHG